MSVHNAEIAQIFDEYADLIEIQGTNQFWVRAYRTAARSIADLSQSLADMVAQGEDLSELPGIGRDLAAKVADIVTSGRLPQLEELEKEVPAGLLDLTRLARAGRCPQHQGLAGTEEIAQEVSQ